jgi:hypothetical protein
VSAYLQKELRHDTAVSHIEPPPPVRTGRVANVGDRRTAGRRETESLGLLRNEHCRNDESFAAPAFHHGTQSRGGVRAPGAHRSTPVIELVALRILELISAGESDPDRLTESAVATFR